MHSITSCGASLNATLTSGYPMLFQANEFFLHTLIGHAVFFRRAASLTVSTYFHFPSSPPIFYNKSSFSTNNPLVGITHGLLHPVAFFSS